MFRFWRNVLDSVGLWVYVIRFLLLVHALNDFMTYSEWSITEADPWVSLSAPRSLGILRLTSATSFSCMSNEWTTIVLLLCTFSSPRDIIFTFYIFIPKRLTFQLLDTCVCFTFCLVLSPLYPYIRLKLVWIYHFG